MEPGQLLLGPLELVAFNVIWALLGQYPAMLQPKRQQLPRYSNPLKTEAAPLTKIFGHLHGCARVVFSWQPCRQGYLHAENGRAEIGRAHV